MANKIDKENEEHKKFYENFFTIYNIFYYSCNCYCSFDGDFFDLGGNYLTK